MPKSFLISLSFSSSHLSIIFQLVRCGLFCFNNEVRRSWEPDKGSGSMHLKTSVEKARKVRITWRPDRNGPETESIRMKSKFICSNHCCPYFQLFQPWCLTGLRWPTGLAHFGPLPHPTASKWQWTLASWAALRSPTASSLTGQKSVKSSIE